MDPRWLPELAADRRPDLDPVGSGASRTPACVRWRPLRRLIQIVGGGRCIASGMLVRELGFEMLDIEFGDNV
jgi:hypothetical protein